MYVAAEKLCSHSVSTEKEKVIAGNSHLLHTCLSPSPSDGKWKMLFVFPTVTSGYLSCRLHRPRIKFLLRSISCQIRAWGSWRPLAANITQIIMGLVVHDKLVPLLSFPFLSSHPKITLSVQPVFGFCRCSLCIA